ncbi:MAG: 50S ribosomal protein L18e [Candidatus Aenigmatarchaeota archaeon]|nr:50S ribosomal protein L18e [Candidatus Aenigmarchaeota archaeon]
MVKRTGPTNPYLRQLIDSLKKKSLELKSPIWKDVAEKLSKSTRQRIEVNLSDIERNVVDGETIIVPGVVLASGNLTKKVNVAAWRFSTAAKEKIKNANGKIMTFDELMKENPKGSNVRIIS